MVQLPWASSFDFEIIHFLEHPDKALLWDIDETLDVVEIELLCDQKNFFRETPLPQASGLPALSLDRSKLFVVPTTAEDSKNPQTLPDEIQVFDLAQNGYSKIESIPITPLFKENLPSSGRYTQPWFAVIQDRPRLFFLKHQLIFNQESELVYQFPKPVQSYVLMYPYLIMKTDNTALDSPSDVLIFDIQFLKIAAQIKAEECPSLSLISPGPIEGSFFVMNPNEKKYCFYFIDPWRKQKMNLLLCLREKQEHSLFYKEFLPLDIFKQITKLSLLW